MPWVCYAFGNFFPFENGVLVDQSHQVQHQVVSLCVGLKTFFLILKTAQVASSGFFKSTLSSSEAVQQQQYFPLLPQVFNILIQYILYIIYYIL